LKILIITSNYPTPNSPSSGSFVQSQVQLLRNKGHKVDVLVINFTPIARRKIHRNLKIFYSKLELTPIEYNEVEINYFNFLNKYIHQKINFLNSSNWIEYNIIHAHDCIWAGYFASLIRNELGIKFILTSHKPFVLESNFTSSKLTFDVINNASLIFTVGHLDKNILRSTFANKKIVCIGNFIDENLFNSIERKIENHFEITTVTSTSIRKNLPLFIELISKVKERIHELTKSIKVNLVLATINDGITLSEIKRLIDINGLNEIISIQLNLTQEQIIQVYNNTDLLISTSGYETFGMTIAEALSMNIPVLAIKNGASEDFIPKGMGEVFLESQLSEMVESMVLYINSKIKSSQNGHDYIKSQFGREVFYNNLMNGYQSILK
jgi:glycosyltransferase involved in cell wall biosynthesis